MAVSAFTHEVAITFTVYPQRAGVWAVLVMIPFPGGGVLRGILSVQPAFS